MKQHWSSVGHEFFQKVGIRLVRERKQHTAEQ
jgi:hypothetical protein